MTLTPRLELKFSQTLVMTPQLQQMSNIDLNEFVEAEIAENPMLERDDSNAAKNQEGSPEVITEQNELSDDTGGLEMVNIISNEHVTESQVNALDMENYDNVWDSEPAAEPATTIHNEDGGSISEWSRPLS